MKKAITFLLVAAAMFASKGTVNSYAGNGDGFSDIPPALPAIPVNVQN